MQETQLLYLLMTLSMGHPADVPHRPSTPQTTQDRAITLNQPASARLISLRCPQPHDQKSRSNETEHCRMRLLKVQ